jgi:hypothetical protein
MRAASFSRRARLARKSCSGEPGGAGGRFFIGSGEGFSTGEFLVVRRILQELEARILEAVPSLSRAGVSLGSRWLSFSRALIGESQGRLIKRGPLGDFSLERWRAI